MSLWVTNLCSAFLAPTPSDFGVRRTDTKSKARYIRENGVPSTACQGPLIFIFVSEVHGQHSIMLSGTRYHQHEALDLKTCVLLSVMCPSHSRPRVHAVLMIAFTKANDSLSVILFSHTTTSRR